VIKIEIEEKPISMEISMETQTITKERRANFKKIHYALMLFLFVEVMFYFTFSAPFTSLFNHGEPLFPITDDAIMSRTARLIMIYHSLAVPFLVANTFWILEYYPVREKWIPTLKALLIPGAFLVGINGLLFAYTRFRLFHEFFYVGMFIVFLGGIIFVVSAMPVPGKFPDPKTNPSGSTLWGLNLEYLNLVILAICIFVSAIMAALAALENFTGTIWGLGRPTEAFLPEAIVRHYHHDTVEAYIVSHLHIQLAQSTAMVLMVAYRTSRISGKAYRGVLAANAVGVIVISYGAWVLNHYVIWVGAGILILCTITMAGFGLRNVAKDQMGDDFETASFFEKFKGLISDPVRFTYYFLFIWGQVIVTITGIAVGLQTDELYRSHYFIYVEYSFNVGHWHVLSILIATMLMVKSIDFFGVTGKQRKYIGWTFFVGSIFTFGGVNIYMLRTVAADPIPSLFLTFTGVWFLVVAYLWGLVLISRAFKKTRREKKLALAKTLLLEEPLTQERKN
jgi:hypothetical protein